MSRRRVRVVARATTPGGCVSHADYTAKPEIGRSDSLAAGSATRRRRPASTSVHAFSLPRVTADVLSRVMDVASSQRLVDAPSDGYERRPISRHERPHPPGVVARATCEMQRPPSRSRRRRQSFGFVAKTVSSIMNPRSSISSADWTACAMSSPRSFVGFSLFCGSPAVA